MSGPILSTPPIAAATVATNELRREFQTLLLALAQRLGRQPLRVKLPVAHDGMPGQGMAYQFKPEIHFQLAGESEFVLPGSKLLVLAGEMAVIPALVPHRLLAARVNGGASRRMIVGFYSSAVSIRYDQAGGGAGIEAIGFYQTARLRQIVEITELLIDYHRTNRPHGAPTQHALEQTLLWMLIDLLDDEVPETGSDSNRMFQIKWLVHSHLSNPDLSVAFLAEQLRVSPGHLSHLFGSGADGSLTQYIHQQRVARAIEALGSNKLSVSEIAWACGFTDPGYFARVFRKQTGMTPQAYRKKLEEDARLIVDE
ncbi:MAG: AraC family transcriptional regulator [Rariglobus sp.]|jgi:AraC-like DNA-binding protein|nr:AraC family transcriptional regulator [Rariglobus sp.]